ncbi:MAG: acyl-CoA synthetase [Proteobacteria bacterium]|nr:acyl-CoA synthetase [Pseudomonadota bacterium]
MTAPAPAPPRLQRASGAPWQRTPERGSAWVTTVMIWLSLRVPRPLARLLLYPIVLYFVLSAPRARRASRSYLRRALGGPPNARERFRHFLVFATSLLDRVYLANGRAAVLHVTVQGAAQMQRLAQAGQGAFLLGAHLGCLEVISALAGQQRQHRIVMAMETGNAGDMATRLRTASEGAGMEIIGLGRLDAMLRLRERLEEGAFVGMLADRTVGDSAAQPVEFLGKPALFPTGPMRIAAALKRPAIFMAGLYRGANHYHVMFHQIADFSRPDPAGRDAAVRAAVTRFAALLEDCCRSDPFNWFNFYDFWAPAGEDTGAATARVR